MTDNIHYYRTLCEKRVVILHRFSEEDADRFEAAIEISWNDIVSLKEIAEDINSVIAEERRKAIPVPICASPSTTSTPSSSLGI